VIGEELQFVVVVVMGGFFEVAQCSEFVVQYFVFKVGEEEADL
jgi:hypothetical protein